LYDNNVAPFTDAGRQAFARWAVASIQHFQGRGIIWEMWNEPDDGFWRPKANVDDYVKLALAVGDAIRKAAPDEIYVGPGVSGFAWAFLEGCFKAGLLNYWSAVSFHPYRQRYPETAMADYQALRSLMAKYAPPGRQIPIITSEWGYSLEWGFVHDEDNQARIAARVVRINLAAGIPLTIWYDWNFHPFSLTQGDYLPGREPVYQPRQNYKAIQTLTSVLSNYRFERRLPANSDDFVLQFQNGGQLCLAAWTTGNPHAITIPFSGRFRAIGITGQALPAPAVTGRGISLNLTQAPQYLVQ